MVVLRILAFLLGLYLTARTIHAAVQTFVLPRSAPDPVTGFAFRNIRRVFDLLLRRADSYGDRDRVMAFYAPYSLLLLLPYWLLLITVGFAGMFWATGMKGLWKAFTLSGSSLLTLGFARGTSQVHTVMAFIEATIGLMLVALLIAYLPLMYTAFARRENAVTRLEIRAGTPPSALEMLRRLHRLERLDQLTDVWLEWEIWFSEVEESHTSLAALVFFRSPQPDHSWVTAAGAILDAAALTASSLDLPRDPQAELCLRAGYLALRRIADFFRVEYNADPHFPQDPISVSRAEFDEVYDVLRAEGLPVVPDRNQAWRDFGGWRVNYDRVLLALSALTMAPYAPWSSDRSLVADRIRAQAE